MTVLLHPEATDDPQTLRWVTDTTTVDDDVVAALRVGDLRDVLADIQVGPGEIRTRLHDGRTWAADGARVRTALFTALSGAHAGTDLRGRIHQLLTREVEPFVSSHGGTVRLISAHDDVVEVALDGTCGHCTLRGQTLSALITKVVRAKFPQIREVRAVST